MGNEESAYDQQTAEIVKRFNVKVHQIMQEAREDIVATLREPPVWFY